jgi:RimJ/RimL family protein N-acetyltransferase
MIEIEMGTSGCPGLARLEASDTEAVGRLFTRLSAESLYRRFFSPISRLDHFTSSVLRVDSLEREAVAAVEDGEIIGVAQYSRRPGADTAELAILVADAWQRQGLGTRMIAALEQTAFDHGIRAFAVDVQGDNYGALRLLRRVAPGLHLAFSGGVGEGVFGIGNES